MPIDKTFSVQAVLDGFRPLKDGSVSVTFHTQELTNDHKLQIMEFFDTFGHLLFAKNQVDISDIPDNIDYDAGGKSPSQRLRGVLFILWKQSNTGTDFDVYYNRKMEDIINQVKGKLDETPKN